MEINGNDGERDYSAMLTDEDIVGEWVELALEAPNGDELGRMLRRSQAEEYAWRRLQAAEQRVNALVHGEPA